MRDRTNRPRRLMRGGISMSNSRREFLQSGAALAVAIAGGAATKLAAEPQASPQAQKAAPAAADTTPHVQIPKMKFGSAEISRLVMGVNPMYGYAHYNNK